MRIIRKFLNILIVGIIFIAFNKCTEKNPVIEKQVWAGPDQNGDLRVMVHHDLTYTSGVNVQLFLSDAARTANTDGTTDFQYQLVPTALDGDSIYATFYNLPYQKYYIKAIIPLGPWKGTGEVYVKKVYAKDKGNVYTLIDIACN